VNFEGVFAARGTHRLERWNIGEADVVGESCADVPRQGRMFDR